MADDQPQELVRLDRIGVVPQPGDDLRALVFAPSLPETARQRLQEDPRFELTDDVERLGEVDAALLSTRMPRGEVVGLTETVAAACHGPVVALAHTGGEAVAVELVRHGARTVLGEGDELSLAAVLTGLDGDTGLLDAYDRSNVGGTSADGGRGLDPVTGLLDRSSMRARIEDLLHDDEMPRVAFARLLHLPSTPRELSHEGLAALRRRIAAQFLHLASRVDAQLFALGPADFGVLGGSLSPNDADRLARGFTTVAKSFVPSGVQPLGLAFGHAGPEVATETSLLLELAQRALDVASQDREGAIVSAELLALGMASSTELQSSMQVLQGVERAVWGSPGHGERVATLATMLASELGYEGQAATRIRLAAHLHQIGRAGLPKDTMVADPSTLTGELLEMYRSYPQRSADYLLPVAGAEVAGIVRHHTEHVDGSGFPHGLQGHEVPVPSRIVAGAVAMVRVLWETRHAGANAAAPLAVEKLRDLSGTVLDPEVVEIAASLLTRGVGAGMFALAS